MSGPAGEPLILERRVAYPSAVLKLLVPESAACFRGHFPGRPVVPGVVQLHWAIRLAGEALETGDARITGLEALKFKQTIPPNTTLSLNLRYADDKRKLHFDYSIGDDPVSSGRILLG